MEETRKIPIREVGTKDKEYPEKLCQYTGMPDKLYVRGTFPDPEKPTAAIVGARAATPYGRIQAFRYAKYLSEAGVQVISGMAYGIDTEAHRGALEGRGGTWAVLGNGPDICYPAGNRGLYQRILRTGGGIISEQTPGTKGIEYENPVKIKTKNDLGLATDLKLVYSCLDLRPKSMDFLIQKTGLPPEKIGSLMLELTLSGLALEVGRHYYVKTT